MSLLLTGIVLLLGIILYPILSHWNQRRSIYNRKTGEIVHSVPFWDIAWYFFSKTNNSYDRAWLLPQIKDKEVYMFFLGPQATLFVADHKLAHEMLIDGETFPKMPNKNCKTMARFFGDHNVGNSNGHTWKRQRNLMNPAFTNLEIYQEIFTEKASEVIQSMIVQNDGKIENINEFMQRMTLDILGKAIFDHDFHAIQGSTKDDINAYNHIMESTLSPVILFLGDILEYIPGFPMISKLNHSIDVIQDLFRSLIQEATVKLKSKTSGKSISMLEYMVQGNMSSDQDEHLTREELLVNTGIFFLAGHETTATALSYELTILAKNPELQEKLRSEIMRQIPEKKINKENLGQCEFLNAFIKESMRFYPPVQMLPTRTTSKDTWLGDWWVPKGTLMGYNILAVHMSKKAYGDPEIFRPERWLPDELAKHKIPYNAWIPFGAGARVCIGNNFSLYEQRVFLVELLSKYKIETCDHSDIRGQRGLVITPPQSCHLIFSALH